MSPESSTCPYVVLKNKGLNLGGCALSTRMTRPRGGFGPAGRVGRRHRLAATGGGARPGHPPFQWLCLVGPARATPQEPHLQRGSGSWSWDLPSRSGCARWSGTPGRNGGCAHSTGRAGPGPCPRTPKISGSAVGSCARARPGRGVLLSRMVARAPTGGAVWSPGARAAGRQKNKRGTEAPLSFLLLPYDTKVAYYPVHAVANNAGSYISNCCQLGYVKPSHTLTSLFY